MAAAILGAGALLGTRKSSMVPTGAPPSAKTPSSSKNKKRVIDSGATTMTGGKVKTTIDTDALPREVKEKASEVKVASDKMKKKVTERRDKGDLSPTMPKKANQISSDFGLDPFAAKAGKMVKARGGGMARMKPTKLY